MSILDRDRHDEETLIEELLRGGRSRVPGARRSTSRPSAATARTSSASCAADQGPGGMGTVHRYGVRPGVRSAVQRVPRVPIPQSAVITLNLDHLRFHAQGGLGVICSASDNRLDRELAVKFAAGPNGSFWSPRSTGTTARFGSPRHWSTPGSFRARPRPGLQGTALLRHADDRGQDAGQGDRGIPRRQGFQAGETPPGTASGRRLPGVAPETQVRLRHGGLRA